MTTIHAAILANAIGRLILGHRVLGRYRYLPADRPTCFLFRKTASSEQCTERPIIQRYQPLVTH